MRESRVISDYLDSLADALSFDGSLSQRVRREVEDHLREAVAADLSGDALEAERRAVANFGDPRVIAAQFAVGSLARHARRVSTAVVAATATVFIAMKVRVAWYAAVEWTTGDDLRAISGIAGVVDRFAFWLLVGLGIVGWAYISSRPVPAVFKPTYRRQIRRCVFLCAAAAGALIVTVISDGLLTAVRLLGTELSIGFVVPICSMAIEVACAGVLVFLIRGITRRTLRAVPLERIPIR